MIALTIAKEEGNSKIIQAFCENRLTLTEYFTQIVYEVNCFYIGTDLDTFIITH